MDTAQAYRTGRWALLAGILGIVAVGLLITALAAPTPEVNGMRRETSLFAWQNGGVIPQALAMIPVTLGLHRLSADSAAGPRVGLLWLGLVAQVSLIVTSALLFPGLVSDMLYMGPIGLVGLWLLLVNRPKDEPMSKGVAWTGRVAGAGLLAVGAGFVIYGAAVAPAVFIRPLTNAEIDAQSLTTGNLVAHVLMAVGTLLGRLIYPIWALLLGRQLIGRSRARTGSA